MSPTKTQLLEELKKQVDEQTYQALVTEFQNLPEQLTADDLAKVDAVLAELEETEKIAAHTYNRLADTLDRTADKLTDAADEFIERSAQATYDNAKLAKDLMSE